jgi:hypothetical protein
MSQKVGSFTFEPFYLRLGRILVLFALLFTLQIVTYYRSFAIKPASDDFPVVHEIQRGNQFGPTIFFRESMSNMHHRPFKSLGIWWFGRLSDAHPMFWIRVLHFLAMASYVCALALWVAELRLSLLGTLVAGCVLMFHPTMPQALASVDGVDSIASSALIWLGAWLVLLWRDQIWLALTAAVVCFLLAAGWKEYSFALVPLATWTIFCFSSKNRWRRALSLLAGMLVAFVVLLLIRKRAIPPGYGEGTNYASLNPLQWGQNAIVIFTGLLFFGNSIWVFVHQNAAVLAIVGVSVIAAFAIIAAGTILWLQSNRKAPSTANKMLWIVFVLGCFVAASFPVNIIIHVSEMYLVPLFVPLAIFSGIAADGWRGASKPWRCVVLAATLGALISSLITIHVKVEGLRNVGERAERQLRQIIALLPPDAHDLKVAVVFDLSELPPRRTYSVYRMGDENLVVHPMALDWIAPQRHLTLGSFSMTNPDFDPAKFDVLLKWNAATQQFQQVNAVDVFRPPPPG